MQSVRGEGCLYFQVPPLLYSFRYTASIVPVHLHTSIPPAGPTLSPSPPPSLTLSFINATEGFQ